ncbi:MAG: hypothetical protein AAF488_05530 [Planctomycetota bacterium]
MVILVVIVGVVVTMLAVGPAAPRLLYKAHAEVTLECSDDDIVLIPDHVTIGGFVPAPGQSWSLAHHPGRSGTPFRLLPGAKLVFLGGLVVTRDDFGAGSITVVTETRRMEWLPVAQYRSFLREEE